MKENFLKYIKENDIKLDNSITEEVELDDRFITCVIMYKLSTDIVVDEEDEDIPVVEIQEMK